MSLSLVAVLVLVTFFGLVTTHVPMVKAYVTPGSGVFWNMDDLVANSLGDVIGLGPGVYAMLDDLTISISDTVYMRDGETILVNPGFGIFVEGTLLSNVSTTPVVFRSGTLAPEPQDWTGIIFNGGMGRFNRTIIRHADTGIAINNGDVTIKNSTLELNYPYAIFFNGGLLYVNGSRILGSMPPSASLVPDGGFGIYAIGNIVDTLWLNRSTIVGGNATDNGFGREAIFGMGLVGYVGVIGNKMIVGGNGGNNSIDGLAAGSGGFGMHFMPVWNAPTGISMSISGNQLIRGGHGGHNNASTDGASGLGSFGIVMGDGDRIGSVVISNNRYVSGGDGGDNFADWGAGWTVGGGGYGIGLNNIGGNRSRIGSNTLIVGGKGGNNSGAGNMFSPAGPGGDGVILGGVANLQVINNTIRGGHGGNNTITGINSVAGDGGPGLRTISSVVLTVTDTFIYGGEGGDDYLGTGPGIQGGAGRGGAGLLTDDTLGTLTSGSIQGGEGGDNYGLMGWGGYGGYGVELIGPMSMSFDLTTVTGGKGGDNYHDAGNMAGAGSQAFFINNGQRMLITNSDVIGGAGGDCYAGANAIGGMGATSITIFGGSRGITIQDNPLITVGAGGIQYLTWVNGTKGMYGIDATIPASRLEIIRNYIYNASMSGIYSNIPGLLIDGNTIESNQIGMQLYWDANWANITGNTLNANTARGIVIFQIDNIFIGGNSIDGGDFGIMAVTTNDVHIDRTTVNGAGIWAMEIEDFSDRVLIENSTITNSVIGDLSVSNTANATTLNTTFDGALVNVPPGSVLTVKNYLHVKVLDLFLAPLPTTDVEVRDNGVPVYSSIVFPGTNATTDANGEVNWIVVTDRIYVGSNTATENTTDAEVFYPAKTFVNNPRGVNMYTTHQEIFQEFGADGLPPEILNVLLNGAKFVDVPAGTLVDVIATVDDTLTGNSNISNANYTIGWQMWGSSVPMNAVFPPFDDNPVEPVIETIDTTTWFAGSYEIWVYGCDALANCNITGDFATLNITAGDAAPPRILNVLVDGVTWLDATPGTLVAITATVDDTITGNSNISNANYTIGQDNWPTSTPINPTDLAFDSPIEDVDEIIDTAGWAPGPYEIWVYGCDDQPNCNYTGDFATININIPPEVHNVSANGLPFVAVPAGTLVTLNATLNDTLTGGSDIDGANYTIGMANWPGTAMSPTDGLFDEVAEDVTVVVDTTSWACGNYSLFVYGWDVVPNYNTTSTANATITINVCDFEAPEIVNVRIDGLVSQTFYLSTLPPTFMLTADIDDEATGDTPIGGANYTTPADNWPSSTPMTASDGAFDSVFEPVEAVVTTPITGPGLHEYCVYAWDQVVPPNYNTTGSCAFLVISDDLPPDIPSVLLNGSSSISVMVGSWVNLTATADDWLRGVSDILDMNYTVGPLNWSSSTPMIPIDGGFNDPAEDAYAIIDTTGWPIGLHTICVNAVDDMGNRNDTCIVNAILNIFAGDIFPPEIFTTLADGLPSRLVPAGALVTITATVDDSATGGSNILFANFTVDGDWLTSTPMNAQDGTYDEVNETVIGTANTAGWAPGPHQVCVYGGDVAFNNNTTSVACATITIVADNVPPTVTGSPTGTGIAVDTNITLNFNEPMDTDIVNASFSYTDLIGTWDQAAGSIAWSNGNRTMIFNPTSDLEYSTTYIIIVNGSVAMDTSGNFLDGNSDGVGGDDYIFYFKTEDEPPPVDTTPPTVTGTEPDDGETDLPTTTRVIEVTFNEPMDEDTVDVDIDGISTIESWDGNRLIITLLDDLDYGSTYTVSITDGEDLAGNTMEDDDFTFDTESAPPPPIAAFDWLWILIVVLAVIIAILAALLLKRRKPEAEEPVYPAAEEEAVEAEEPVEEEAPPPPSEEQVSEEVAAEEGELIEEADA